jgi:hypothetical protein
MDSFSFLRATGPEGQPLSPMLVLIAANGCVYFDT